MEAKNNGGVHPDLTHSVQDLADVDLREFRLFVALDVERRGVIHAPDLLDLLTHSGIGLDDFRLRQCVAALRRYRPTDTITYADFCRIIRPNILLVERIVQGNIVIPDFDEFSREVTRIFEDVRGARDGDVARYIPQLAKVNPELYAVAVCTIDGQRFSLGDATTPFCLQSCSKPANYCLALEEHGAQYVHRFVGREPSGRRFNELTLNHEGKPHNPLLNAGAIMCLALIRPHDNIADRFDYLMDHWQALAGGIRPGFSNSVYLSERQTADRNFALGYFMREHKAFPESTNLIETLEFYFQCCSIELTAELMAMAAATLANGGVCPATGERVLNPKTVQNCLSLMYSCGMYDFSGEWAFTIGLPAKSGVSGAIMVVVPNVLGMCIWSPRLDANGNSARGIEFCKGLVQTFNFHNYDNLTGLTEKVDPRLTVIESEARKVDELIWAASKGNLGAVQRLVARGVNLNGADYDGRTPLHLAAVEGRANVVAYLIDQHVNMSPSDRWGGTPLDDASSHGHEDVMRLLEAFGGQRGRSGRSRSIKGEATWPVRARVDSSNVIELIWAAARGSLRAIQRLVARGADLASKDYDRRTALHLAAAEGWLYIVEYFLNQGLDPNPRDRWGGTPLDDAHRRGHKEIAGLLEQRGGVVGDTSAASSRSLTGTLGSA